MTGVLKKEERDAKARSITLLGLYVNIALTVFKITVGVLAHSTAIIADAFHSFSDFATDIALLYGIKLASKPADKSHDYGHGKVETLMSMTIGFVLLLAGCQILFKALEVLIKCLQGYVLPKPGWVAVVAIIVSIVLKEWTYRMTVRVGHSIDHQAVVANAWEHRSDAVSSFGVMIGILGAILLGESWRVLDPIAALTVSVFIIRTAITLSKEPVNELIEASLSDETEEKIVRIIKAVPGAQNPHDLKTRRIGKNIAIEIHVEVDRTLDIVRAHDIATDIEQRIRDEFGEGTFISVHVEPLP